MSEQLGPYDGLVLETAYEFAKQINNGISPLLVEIRARSAVVMWENIPGNEIPLLLAFIGEAISKAQNLSSTQETYQLSMYGTE